MLLITFLHEEKEHVRTTIQTQTVNYFTATSICCNNIYSCRQICCSPCMQILKQSAWNIFICPVYRQYILKSARGIRLYESFVINWRHCAAEQHSLCRLPDTHCQLDYISISSIYKTRVTPISLNFPNCPKHKSSLLFIHYIAIHSFCFKTNTK